MGNNILEDNERLRAKNRRIFQKVLDGGAEPVGELSAGCNSPGLLGSHAISVATSAKTMMNIVLEPNVTQLCKLRDGRFRDEFQTQQLIKGHKPNPSMVTYGPLEQLARCPTQQAKVTEAAFASFLLESSTPSRNSQTAASNPPSRQTLTPTTRAPRNPSPPPESLAATPKFGMPVPGNPRH
uniref:Uncharacterized protein n=1 Tax=Oryza nivara TaxID=4536 RepID=A0A0E0GHP9_ORYNI